MGHGLLINTNSLKLADYSQRKARMSNKKFFIAVFIVMMIIAGLVVGSFTISHDYGPFMGQVVEAESGEPIEGAVVLIGFSVEASSVGGTVYIFADAVETLTDSQGEFNIPTKRVEFFKLGATWSDECQISIFKPGYGAYPGHRKSHSSFNTRLIPENEHVTYYLPKLKTIEQRKKNLRNIIRSGGAPIGKMPKMRKLKDEERLNVGID